MSFFYEPGSDTEIAETYELGASLSVLEGEPGVFSSGKAIKCTSQTDKPDFIFAEDKESDADDLVMVRVIPTIRGFRRISTIFTPLVNGLAAQSNASDTVVKVALTDGSADDLNGGLVYIPELDECRNILDSSYSSNVVTLTVLTPFKRAVTTGDTVVVVPFNVGYSPKLKATTFDSISSAIADKNNGYCKIHKVDMKRKRAKVCFAV